MSLSSPERAAGATRMSPLSRLVRDLASFDRALELTEMAALVAASGVRRADVARYFSLQDDTYCHRHVYRSSLLEIGCIGWRPKQHTPVHHHAGSACCVLVLAGSLTNTEFIAADQPYAAHERTLRAGELLTYRGHELHRMANDSTKSLFTLHVYSPPLPAMSTRSS